MKYLAGLFFSLLMAHVAHAGKLCESSCDALTISFPDGGSIEAVEALSFQFGDGGVLNDGSVTTGYSSGDLLSLAAGETLDFQDGGSLDLGSAGNLDYSSISITTAGLMIVASGTGQIVIFDLEFNTGVLELLGGAIELRGNLSGSAEILAVSGASLTVLPGAGFSGVENLIIDVDGIVEIKSDDEAVTSSGCDNVFDSGSLTISSGVTVIDTIGCTGTLLGDSIISGDATITGLTVTELLGPDGIIVVPDSGITIDEPLNGGEITLITFEESEPVETGALSSGEAELVNGGEITITPINAGEDAAEPQPLTQDLVTVLPDGAELPTSDGGSCTIDSGDCIDASGNSYVAVDGALQQEVITDQAPAAANGSGALGWFLLLYLCCMVSVRSRHQPN